MKENISKENLKNKKAVAVKYKSDYKAPKIVAKGKGYVAEKILENAEKSEVTIIENKELVEELEKIDLGLEIPQHLYEAVAQVLVFVSSLDKKAEYRKYGK